MLLLLLLFYQTILCFSENLTTQQYIQNIKTVYKFACDLERNLFFEPTFLTQKTKECLTFQRFFNIKSSNHIILTLKQGKWE